METQNAGFQRTVNRGREYYRSGVRKGVPAVGNERKRERREESVRSREAELALNAPSPSALLETLVNQIVIAVEHDPHGGTYSLHFADGRTAVFEGSFAMEGGEGA